MAEPRGQMPAAAGRGRLRASHADREQVIGMLKTAFVRGMLAKGEFDLRVGRTLASRTYADLAAVTADLPAGLTAAQPPPAGQPGETRGLRRNPVIMVATALYVGMWPVVFMMPWQDRYPHAGIGVIVMVTFFYVIMLLVGDRMMLDSWRAERSGGQQPRGPAPDAAGVIPRSRCQPSP